MVVQLVWIGNIKVGIVKYIPLMARSEIAPRVVIAHKKSSRKRCPIYVGHLVFWISKRLGPVYSICNKIGSNMMSTIKSNCGSLF